MAESMNTRPQGSSSLVSSIESRANKINHGYSVFTGLAGYRGRQNFRAINYSKVCRPILGSAVQIFGSIRGCICVDGVRLSGWYSTEYHFFFSSLDFVLIGSIDQTVRWCSCNSGACEFFAIYSWKFCSKKKEYVCIFNKSF